MKKSQSGFTLVELVVVILILGILGATALPRFMNVNTQAHEAAVSGAGGGIGAGVALVHAQWIANGSTGAVTGVSGFGTGNVAVNTSGWPIGIDGTFNDETDCSDIWYNVMQNPPTAANAATIEDYEIDPSGATGCLYVYRPATSPTTMSIIYETTTGAVTVDDVL